MCIKTQKKYSDLEDKIKNVYCYSISKQIKYVIELKLYKKY